jgi:hypothetical protein
MNAVISTMLGYLGVFLLFLFFFNFLSKGYLISFIRVKAARGKKVLINVKATVGGFYSVIGKLEGEYVIFHDRESKANKQKTPKRVPISNADFSLVYGCWCINIDEATSSVFKPTGEIINVDVIKYNNLYERALYKPSPEANEKILNIIMLIVCIITLLGMVVLFTKLSKLEGAVAALGKVANVVGVNV